MVLRYFVFELHKILFDVFIDLRKKSETFKSWGGVKLNDSNKKMLWIPEGFAHGFLTLTNEAEVQYKTTEYWSKEHEGTIKWNDPKISINWPDIINSPKVSGDTRSA